MAGAVTAIAAAAAGDAGAAVIVVVVRKVVREGAIFLPPNMLRRRVVNFADMTIAAASSVDMTTAVRKVRAVQALRLPISRMKRLFSPANRWQNIAISL